LFRSCKLQHFIPTMRAAFVLCIFVTAAASSSQQQALEPLTKYRRMSLDFAGGSVVIAFLYGGQTHRKTTDGQWDEAFFGVAQLIHCSVCF
jgi:hypothetical protein